MVLMKEWFLTAIESLLISGMYGGMMGGMMGGMLEKMSYLSMSVSLLGQGIQV